ncbi:MAG: hypothetical protein HYW07_11275 [Candidatus Latescibacteria bacterium]|nr:hypothetical protein [Candidatus Latescibacterota bacterium]
MKITRIDSYVVDAGWRPWIFVEVYQLNVAPHNYYSGFVARKVLTHWGAMN